MPTGGNEKNNSLDDYSGLCLAMKIIHMHKYITGIVWYSYISYLYDVILYKAMYQVVNSLAIFILGCNLVSCTITH